jgi:DNA topoisomerase-1
MEELALDNRPPADLPSALVYVSDQEPGIRRRRAGRGFTYVGKNGARISGEDVLARIRSLAIPPAWTDVWISSDPLGHIQATGRDQRGRKQYRYHPLWSNHRDAAKYSSLADFSEALPKLRSVVDADLRRHGLPLERVVASIVWLLDNTMIRVGNDDYARTNKSYGLTTLRQRHVAVNGSELRFSFKGKSGKEWRIRLVDRRMARIVRSIQDLPGQDLFQYIDDHGNRQTVRSQDVNAYIRSATEGDFTSKHFRTWGGTIAAIGHLANVPLPETKTETRRELNRAVDRVAAMLGNTRSVCRACYIHPAVLESWEAGCLADELAAIRRSFRKPLPGLGEGETLVVKWLASKNGGAPDGEKSASASRTRRVRQG